MAREIQGLGFGCYRGRDLITLLKRLPARGIIDSVVLMTSFAGHVRSRGNSTNTGPGIPCCETWNAWRITGTCAWASTSVTLHDPALEGVKWTANRMLPLVCVCPTMMASLKKAALGYHYIFFLRRKKCFIVGTECPICDKVWSWSSV